MGKKKDFGSYFFEKLVFPRIIMIDIPGMIVSRSVGKISRKIVSQTRTVCCFEAFIVSLYNDTKKVVGEKETDLLWYKISKNSGIRYSFFSGGWRKVPDFILSSILTKVFNILSSNGMSFAKDFKMDRGKGEIVTYGDNCIICRNTGSGCIAAGNLSAIWSSLNGKNIEAEFYCEDCPKCKIVASCDIPIKYDIQYERLRPMRNYSSKNFGKKSIDTNLASFKDLVKFGKISSDKVLNVFYYRNIPISYSEVGLLELVANEYVLDKKSDLFRKIILESSEKLMEGFSSGDSKKDLSEIENMFSAFGWGVFLRGKNEGKIVYRISCPPICKYPPLFRVTILNGFLNKIFNKKFEIERFNDYEYVLS